MRNALKVLTTSAKNTYLKILHVNLTDDTYEVVKDDAPLADGLALKAVSLSGYFAAFAELGLVHEDDTVDFREKTDLEYLRSFFRKNHHHYAFWFTYRRKNETGISSTTMEMIPDEEYSDDHQSLYLFVKDVSAAEALSVNILDDYKALCDNYLIIASMDMEIGEVVMYRMREETKKLVPAVNQSVVLYEDVIQQILSNVIVPEDRDTFRRCTDIDFIRRQLAVHPAYSCDYRVFIKGRIMWNRIKMARIAKPGKKSHVVIGIADISNEKQMATDFYRQGKAILLVDSNAESLQTMEEILSSKHRIITAQSGSEAMDALEQHHSEIALVITGVQMPAVNGNELLRCIKSSELYSAIPVVCATKMGDLEAQKTLLEMGASDCIAMPLNPALVQNRVDYLIRCRETVNILNSIERDALTGLYTKEFFLRYAEQAIRNNPDRKFAVVVTDIRGLRIYNERYGLEAGDQLIRRTAEKASWIPGVAVAGRIEGGCFAALLDSHSYPDWTYSGIAAKLSDFVEHSRTDHVAMKNGIYIPDAPMPVSLMCDRARLAMSSIKGVFGKRIAFYDAAFQAEIDRRHFLTECSARGLREKQFLIHYQPKFNLASGKIEGAEALVRWIHPDMGFISPGDFIPLFEENGFVKQLDTYVFEQVCEDLIRWQKAGLPVVPISVNLSRRDFEISNLDEHIIEHTRKLGLDSSLIHLEITESAFSHNEKVIIQTVERLHEAGFQIELDDFGSGYSSLAALSTIHLDAVKLDISIIRNDNPGADKNILDVALQMAKLLRLRTIQEGVETVHQVQRLKEMGCDAVQGYYYSKPLPTEMFEQFLVAAQ